MNMYPFVRKVPGVGLATLEETGSIPLGERPFIGEQVILEGEPVEIVGILHGPDGLVLRLKEKQHITSRGIVEY